MTAIAVPGTLFSFRQTLCLLGASVFASLMPGLGVLIVFNQMYPSHPSTLDPLYLVEYAVKASANLFFGFLALMIYSNMAFPLVMAAFSYVLSHSGEDLDIPQKKKVKKMDENANCPNTP